MEGKYINNEALPAPLDARLWNTVSHFAFHLRSARLQPGGPDEKSFSPHSTAYVHVWIHVYLQTQAFTRPVKSASGVFAPPHLTDSRRWRSGCLEKTLQLSIIPRRPPLYPSRSIPVQQSLFICCCEDLSTSALHMAQPNSLVIITN